MDKQDPKEIVRLTRSLVGEWVMLRGVWLQLTTDTIIRYTDEGDLFHVQVFEVANKIPVAELDKAVLAFKSLLPAGVVERIEYQWCKKIVSTMFSHGYIQLKLCWKEFCLTNLQAERDTAAAFAQMGIATMERGKDVELGMEGVEE